MIVLRVATKCAILFALAFAVTSLAGCTSSPVTVDSSPTTSGSQKGLEKTNSPELGTRKNPYSVGTSAKWDASSIWTHTVGETNPNSWEAIRAADEWANQAEAGKVYVTAPFHLAMESDDGEPYSPGASIRIDYVTSAGNSIDGTWCGTSVPSPGLIFELGEMYSGAEADYLACAQVPESDVQGGVWRLSYNGPEHDHKVFFVGAP